MSRSHPPTLLRLVLRTLLEECQIPRGARVLLAVSGGSDSTALLDVMGRLGPKLGLVLAAHGVDHGLRPEAAGELDLAERLAASHGIPFSRSRISVPREGNFHAQARELRYGALTEQARSLGMQWVATAHHANDRAETVLMRLMRGGIEGLGVLPPKRGVLLRPMIRAHKRDIMAHLSRHHLAFCTDPSNSDPHYLRSRVRHEVLPLMEQLSPGIIEHLCSLAELALAENPSPPDEGERDEETEGRTTSKAVLGRDQRRAIERAILRSQWGFELPVSGGGRLTLSRAPRPERGRGRERPPKAP